MTPEQFHAEHHWSAVSFEHCSMKACRDAREIPPPDTVLTLAANPKDLVGVNKVPLHLWPETASALGSVAIFDGHEKYGRDNWREKPILASEYVSAIRRHINAWFDEGEEADLDSLVDHLGHAIATLAIVIDARAAGTLIDDRKRRGGYRKLIDELTPLIARIRERHKGRNPRHYTIADNR